MAKIILTKGGTVLQEISLIKERITIGRRPYNDVVIEDMTVSGEHAAITVNFNDVFLEDLNSTNGTQVNGQPVKKHFLQNQDVIEIAEYCLRYVVENGHCHEHSEATSNLTSNDASVDLILDTLYPKTWSATVVRGAKARSGCAIKLLTGANAGREIGIAKPLTTLGQPGVQVAAIARHASGYCLSHVEGEDYPLINGRSIGTDNCVMLHGDVINVAGTRMRFLAY